MSKIFQVCRIHNRACYDGKWMDVYHFVKLLIEGNIKNTECQIVEITCDECKKGDYKEILKRTSVL